MSQNTSETSQKQVMVGTPVWFDVAFKTFQLMTACDIHHNKHMLRNFT